MNLPRLRLIDTLQANSHAHLKQRGDFGMKLDCLEQVHGRRIYFIHPIAWPCCEFTHTLESWYRLAKPPTWWCASTLMELQPKWTLRISFLCVGQGVKRLHYYLGGSWGHFPKFWAIDLILDCIMWKGVGIWWQRRSMCLALMKGKKSDIFICTSPLIFFLSHCSLAFFEEMRLSLLSYIDI